MSLVLQHRWEHALIAAAVEGASAKCPNCYLGRTAMQKLLYFMKVLAVPMRYTFEIHHYGPFCQSIMSDVEWVLADDVITDTSKDARYSNYKPSTGWPELKERYRDKLDEYRPMIGDVWDALSDMSPEALELISTLDFSFRWVRARGGTGPWRAAAIEKFKQIKNDKFQDREVEGWYDALVRTKLIEA